MRKVNGKCHVAVVFQPPRAVRDGVVPVQEARALKVRAQDPGAAREGSAAMEPGGAALG